VFTPLAGSYDQQMTSDMRNTSNAVVGWILMASWCYYIEANPCSLLSDTQFDKACAWLLRHHDSVTHKYKHLLPKEALQAGTAFHLQAHDYPRGVISCAQQARRVLDGVE
jgi:hypothetical protein